MICSVAVIALVLMQDSKSTGGVNAAFGGGGVESFFGKNKSKSRNSRLEFLTKTMGIVIAVLSVALALVYKL